MWVWCECQHSVSQSYWSHTWPDQPCACTMCLKLIGSLSDCCWVGIMWLEVFPWSLGITLGSGRQSRVVLKILNIYETDVLIGLINLWNPNNQPIYFWWRIRTFPFTSSLHNRTSEWDAIISILHVASAVTLTVYTVVSATVVTINALFSCKPMRTLP